MTLYDHSSSPFHLGPFKAEGSTVGRCDFIYVRESIQLSCTSKNTNRIANSAAELHIKPIFTSPGDTPAMLHASNIELQSKLARYQKRYLASHAGKTKTIFTGACEARTGLDRTPHVWLKGLPSTRNTQRQRSVHPNGEPQMPK